MRFPRLHRVSILGLATLTAVALTATGCSGSGRGSSKKIAVNVKRNLSSLMVQATLQPSGVKLDDEKNFVAVPFPQMEAALKTGAVEAVQAVEPFATQLQKSIGARLITDLSQGPTANFP